MIHQFSRTELLIGEEGLAKLGAARIAVFGVGGVGGYCCDALVRSGICHIDIYDNDTVSITNLNRQLIALHSTIDRLKVDVMAERLHDINPDCEVGCHPMFYLPDNADEVDLARYDYVVDAIDTVTAKLELITRCTRLGVPILTALGAGNKLDPGKLQVTDIHKTSVDPLARVIRTECRDRGIMHLKVIYSTEDALKPRPELLAEMNAGQTGTRRALPGSMAFVPAAMGLMIASEVVRDLLKA